MDNTYYTKDFKYVILPDGTIKITDYRGYPEYEEIVFPATLDGREVSTIGEKVLASKGKGMACYGVRVEEGITTIEDEAFSDENISEIYLPESINKVTGNPFWILFKGTVREYRIHFSATHPYLIINDGVMFGKTDKRVICYFSSKREKYIVPDGIKIIGKHAFTDDNLRIIGIHDSVEKIEESGIGGMGLLGVILPQKLKYIGKWAFPAKAVREGIYEIPETVETIEPAAFSDLQISINPNNPNFYIKNDLLIERKTGRVLCCAMPKMTDLVIPDSASAIGKGAFMFHGLKSVKMPNSVERIEDEAFQFNSSLTKVVLSNHLKSIGNMAFDGCKELRLKVPSSVTEIGEDAFGGSDRVKLLVVEPGSYAEEYAKEKRIEYSNNNIDEDPMAWLNDGVESNNDDLLNTLENEYVNENGDVEEDDNTDDENIIFQAGDRIEFGSYYFNHEDNELYPIDWNVVKKDDTTFWLLSRNVIEVMPFNTNEKPREDIPPILDHEGKYAYVWHNSTLREWLNNEFFKIAFDAREKEVMVKQVLTFPSYRKEYEADEFNLRGHADSDSFPNIEDYVSIPPWENEEPEDTIFLNKKIGLPSPYAYDKMEKNSKFDALHYQDKDNYWYRQQLVDTESNYAQRGGSEVPASINAYVRVVIRVDQMKLYNLLNKYNSLLPDYMDSYKTRLFEERAANKERKEELEEIWRKRDQNKGSGD